MRSTEYQSFLDHYEGRVPDELPRDVEVPATDQEVGWLKQQQVRRAIRHKGAGIATTADLSLLDNHTSVAVGQRDYANARKLERAADAANIEKYFG